MSSESAPETGAEPTPRTAPAPFDDLTADFVIRSYDKVDFHVHGSVLRLSSGFFASMLTLPQPDTKPTQEDKVLDVSEDSGALYKLLSWTDPRGTLHLSSLHDAASVLKLAEKYDMTPVISRLMTFVYVGRENYKQHPAALFALGKHYHHPDVTDFAAQESLRFSITAWSDTPLLDLITGRDHQALMLYYFHCQNVVRSVVKDWPQWIGSREYVWKTTWSLHHCTFKPLDGNNYPEWWILYLEAITRALWDTPSAHVLSSIEIFSVTAPANLCTKCKPKYASDLHSFNALLANRLDTMIPRFSTWLSEQSRARTRP